MQRLQTKKHTKEPRCHSILHVRSLLRTQTLKLILSNPATFVISFSLAQIYGLSGNK